ncbi:MAG TPA: FAD-binding oxidoreductase [Burkholderiales bacterium]|nr:FAD-binding oxidoreductase [Burkholderiales bacterium]
MSLDSAVKDLAQTFTGRLLQAGDAGYDDARRVHNGLVDKRPALVARCHGVADVADAVRLARSQGLQVSVRGGGHNVAGRASIDHGVMIDLSPMRGIHVDPRKQTARAQGGVLWNQFNRETQLHGLATTGGVVGSTGLAGLTLGGGLGWLMPKHGLALDNLQAAELVLADGSVRRASADENPDLFWGIRGGGGNFGIAASLEYRLHPIGPIITGGLVAHPLARGGDTLKFFRDRCASLPDEAMLVAGLLTAPDGSTKIAGILLAHCGSLAEGEALATPIKAFGPPAVDHMGPLPYTVLNSLLDAAFPKGALNYWKAQFLTDLSDDCIKTLVECAAACPSPMSQIVLEHFHGKASRVGVTETACAMRISGFNAVIASQWQDSRETERNIKWCRDTFRALQPYFGTTRYVNYLADDESADSAAAAAYGPNYARLREIKSKYDPENFFRMNVNVKPA